MADAQTKLAIKDIEAIFNKSNRGGSIHPYGSKVWSDGRSHYLSSSNEDPAAVVEPRTEKALGQIMGILDKRRVKFGIICGGHATNPKFSSTTGILIRMSQFNQVKFNSNDNTLDVGGGCNWDQVYAVVDNLPRPRGVVGGASDAGVGVAGYLLGGGFSLKTNNFGLGIDNITKMRVVLPVGSVVEASDEKNKDLFQALKGGGNNFGVVTKFTLKTHRSRNSWGAVVSFKASDSEKVKSAIARYAEKEQKKETSVVAAFRYTMDGSTLKYSIGVTCVYHGEKLSSSPKTWPFAGFRKIQGGNVWKPRPTGWGQAQDGLMIKPANIQVQDTTSRGRFGCIMVSKINKAVIDAVEEQTKKCSRFMRENGGKRVLIDVWPFLPRNFKDGDRPAWPPRSNKRSFGPLLAYFTWVDERKDKFWIRKMQKALQEIQNVAIRTGCTTPDAPIYANTALESTTVEQIYRENLKWLSKARKKYDPKKVMDRSGGFRIPHPT